MITMVFPAARSHRWRCLFLFLAVMVLLRVVYSGFPPVKIEHWYRKAARGNSSPYDYWVHDLVVMDYMNRRASWPTSNLGTMLFKDKRTLSKEAYQQEGNFTVLIWKVGKSLEARYIYNYRPKRQDPLSHCSVHNCNFVYEDDAIDTADAVIIHLHRNKVPNPDIRKHRNPEQLWIFLTDESPTHTFLTAPSYTWKHYYDVFNWSMSYRMDSDIPVPYGRVVPLESPRPAGPQTLAGLARLVPHWASKRRDALVAILISDCKKHRMNVVRELMKHMTVHVYGACSDNHKDICPGHYRSDCPVINDYFFYLSFENSRCFQYMTEKIFYNAYSKGAVPIIIGPDSDSALQALPPFSYIYADTYTSAEELARVLVNLGRNENDILAYHSWRRHFEVLNEHGFFKTRSMHYCRVCEALNYNDRSVSVYDEVRLGQFLDRNEVCYPDGIETGERKSTAVKTQTHRRRKAGSSHPQPKAKRQPNRASPPRGRKFWPQNWYNFFIDLFRD